MDPDATLAALREAIQEYRQACSFGATERATDDIVKHFEALDEWLSKGGFLPNAWHSRDDGIFPPSLQREKWNDAVELN